MTMNKIINFLIILSMVVAGYIFYPQLPNRLPIHWNIHGQVDNYAPKNQAVWMFPLITLAIYILFQFLPRLDPKKDKYKLFQKEWEIIQTAFIIFFGYMQFITFYVTLNKNVNMMPLMFIGLGSLFILLGNYLSKIRQNYFIGIKVPWTLSSEENWNKTHRYASWCFVIAGMLTLVEAYFLWFAPVIIFGSIMLASLLPIIYSYLLYKKSVHKMKLVYGILFILGFTLFFIRSISGEDAWICQNGEWIKHGNPARPVPTEQCK